MAWEASLSRRRWARAAALLHALGATPDAWNADLGAIERATARLREQLFGTVMTCVAACPACGARIEFELQTTSWNRAPAEAVPIVVAWQERTLLARLPTMADLIAVEADVTDRATALLARCIESDGAPVSAGALTPPLRDAVAERLAAAPGAPLDAIEIHCSDCGHGWPEPFDLAWFVWQEIDAWAGGTLADVHTLARAYGWTEPEILALSSERRARYLQLVEQG